MRELGLRIQRAVEAEARLGRVDWSTTLTINSKLQLSSVDKGSQGGGGRGGDLHSSARSAYSSHMTSANGSALGAIIPKEGDAAPPPGDNRSYSSMVQGQGLASSQRSRHSAGGLLMGAPHDTSNELAHMDKYPPDEVPHLTCSCHNTPSHNTPSRYIPYLITHPHITHLI